MRRLPDTAYVLVGRCLAPSLAECRKEALVRDLARPALRWEVLLSEANRQHATPLWYARLAAHGLLPLVPQDLAAYLKQLHAANRDRNRILQDELDLILGLFQANGIPVVLLKGAAVFADGLYADPGDRLMSDMDLLVPATRIRDAERLLMMEGYVDDPTNVSPYDTWPGKSRHSHIPGLLHLKKKITIELHYNVAYGLAGRILPAAAVRSAAVSGRFRDHPTAWLNPTDRLLHNALHATLPHREFARATVRLSDLAEFAALLARYADAVDQRRFWSTVRRHDLALPVGSYALLAHLLMQAPLKPPAVPQASRHQARLLSAGPSATEGVGRNARSNAWRTASFCYDLFQLPAWTWTNVCYGDENTPFAARLGCIAGHLLKLRTLGNVFRK